MEMGRMEAEPLTVLWTKLEGVFTDGGSEWKRVNETVLQRKKEGRRKYVVWRCQLS